MGHRITVVPPDEVRPSVALGRIMVSHLESLQRQGGGRPLAKMVPSPLPWPVTPQVNIKEVALMQRPLSSVIDEAHLWKQERGLPADNKQLMMVLSDSAIAKFPYRKNQKHLERVHNTAALNAATLQGGIPKFAPLGEDAPEFKALLKAAQNTTTAKLSQRLKAQDGLLVDKKSGLVIALFKDEESGQIKIAFGGTKSGKNLKSRKRILGGQIQTDIKNFTSLGLPRAYKQAAEFSRLTAELFGADMVSLTGHSLGAGLAQYSAAMNKLPANCFSPAALGKAALKELAANNRLDPDWLKQNIHHYMVKGDPVCNPKGMSWFHRNFSATNLGTRVIIRPQVDKYKGMVASHNHSHEHLEKAVKRRLRVEARAVKSSESELNFSIIPFGGI